MAAVFLEILDRPQNLIIGSLQIRTFQLDKVLHLTVIGDGQEITFLLSVTLRNDPPVNRIDLDPVPGGNDRKVCPDSRVFIAYGIPFVLLESFRPDSLTFFFLCSVCRSF